MLGIVSSGCMVFANEPFALKDTTERKRRAAMLSLPHVQPLADYLRRMKNAQGASCEMPYFDPCDGGVRAKTLFLLEAPGPKAVGSAFVSRNNPDQTARNINELLREAGLPREDTLLWNIVPWYVGDGQKIRPVTSEDIEEASLYLEELIDLLPDLRAIVLVGEKAKSARGRIQRLTRAKIFEAPHPSPKVFNIWPEKREEMQKMLNALTAFLHAPSSCPVTLSHSRNKRNSDLLSIDALGHPIKRFPLELHWSPRGKNRGKMILGIAKAHDPDSHKRGTQGVHESWHLRDGKRHGKGNAVSA